MDRLEVTPSQLDDLADRLVAAAEGIAADLDALGAAADELRLEWRGEAHDEFDLAQTRWRAKANGHREALIGIAAAVRTLATEYGATDRAASRALGGQ